MPTERFFKPGGEALERALEYTRSGVRGAEIYTFLSVNKSSLPDGAVFCREENGKTVSVLYNNGDLTVTKEDGKSPYPGYVIMKFEGKEPENADPAEPLSLRDAMRIYKIIGQRADLSPDDEARYVYRARLMRDGISFGFGIKQDGELISFAFITAQNEDSALIGDVFTVPEYRGRGLAKQCVLSAVKKCFDLGKTAFIVCEEKNVEFYKKTGFDNDTGDGSVYQDEHMI